RGNRLQVTSYVLPRDTVETLQLSSSAIDRDRNVYSGVYAGMQCPTSAAVANNSNMHSDEELLSEVSLGEAQDNVSRELEQYRLELAKMEARAARIVWRNDEREHMRTTSKAVDGESNTDGNLADYGYGTYGGPVADDLRRSQRSRDESSSGRRDATEKSSIRRERTDVGESRRDRSAVRSKVCRSGQGQRDGGRSSSSSSHSNDRKKLRDHRFHSTIEKVVTDKKTNETKRERRHDDDTKRSVDEGNKPSIQRDSSERRRSS